MRLTDVFQNGQLKNAGTQTLGSLSLNVQSKGAGKTVQALVPGQTLQGEVIAREGGKVQIKVGEDLVIEAKVNADINLELGKTMTFEVRSNGQILQLSPLFSNTATQANAWKALEMASLPVTKDSVAMTGLMMEAGLPIDKNSLQQMFREINTFSDANISDVVDLHRLGMAVNEENLTQVQSYKNLTHQLVEGMHTVRDCLEETLQGMVTEGRTEGAAKLFGEILSLVEGIITSEGENVRAGLAGSTNIMAGNGEEAPVAGGIAQVFSDEMTAEELADMVKSVNKESTASVFNGELPDGGIGNGKLVVDDVKEGNETLVNLTTDLSEEGNPAGGSQVLSLKAALTKLMHSLGMEGPYEELLGQGNQDLLAKLVVNQESRKLLLEGLIKPWTIAPEEVADPGKVEELYSRLNRQLKELGQVLEQNGQSQSTAFKAVSNMTQNVDFLQQLNQVYTYIQLPLRLQNCEAHGDLYVYTNKRNLAAGDGQVSALLHLDMEYLGPIDVYVAMQSEHVNTRFYVKDDEMLDFLEQHMDILTNRLQKRGYHCDFAMQVRGEEETEDGIKSGLKGLLAREQVLPVAQYAFDVRA